MGFAVKPMLGKKLYAILGLLVVVLLSGHLTMPRAAVAFDERKLEESRDIANIATVLVEANQAMLEDSETKANKDDKRKQMLAFWGSIQRKSKALEQRYNTMKKYDMERDGQLARGWHELYAEVVVGLEKGLIKAESDLVLRIGRVRLLEEQIYNGGRKTKGLNVVELRPAYTRGEYWRSLAGGLHYFSVAPFVVLILLLHNSFSIDYESGSGKLINSLPVSSVKRNASRLLAQALLALGLTFGCIVLCSFTYPVGEAEYYLSEHGNLLSIKYYLSHNISYAEYLMPAGRYYLQVGLMYGLTSMFASLLTILLSAKSKNGLVALLIPITVFLMLFMPNYMQTGLGKIPSPLTAHLAPQFVLENKAYLSMAQLCGLLLLCGLIFVLGIILTGYQRRRYVDKT